MELVVEAYTRLNQFERDRCNREARSMALFAADVVAIASEGKTEISPERYLPFPDLERRGLPIDYQAAQLILKALREQIIPPKFLGVLAEDLSEIEKIAAKFSTF